MKQDRRKIQTEILFFCAKSTTCHAKSVMLQASNHRLIWAATKRFSNNSWYGKRLNFTWTPELIRYLNKCELSSLRFPLGRPLSTIFRLSLVARYYDNTCIPDRNLYADIQLSIEEEIPLDQFHHLTIDCILKGHMPAPEKCSNQMKQLFNAKCRKTTEKDSYK